MVGTPTRGRRRLQLMIEDLCENSGYEVLKRTNSIRQKSLETKHEKEDAEHFLYIRRLKKKNRANLWLFVSIHSKISRFLLHFCQRCVYN